jgi:hypothetical protein
MKNRHLKISCPRCGYTARATRKWLSVGLPICPCGCEMEPEEKPVPKESNG